MTLEKYKYQGADLKFGVNFLVLKYITRKPYTEYAVLIYLGTNGYRFSFKKYQNKTR